MAKHNPSTRLVDSKGRLTLDGRFAGRTVLLEESEEGSIVIRLARVVPEAEAWLYENPEALKRVRRGLKDAESRNFATKAPNLKSDAKSFGVDE
ncbi:MAG: hypothetical protein ACREJD_15890 [Phycisphaerales bacterium]